MTRPIDRPSVLLIVNIAIALIGFLLLTVGATTINSISKDIENVDEKGKLQTQMLFNLTEKVNTNQIIIHELLTEIKWEKAQLDDFKERLKILEAK